MSSPAATELLRDGLLDGRSLLVAHAPGQDGGYAPSVASACTSLGAAVDVCEIPLGGTAPEQAEADAASTVAEVLVRLGAIDMLIVDAAGLSSNAADPLLDCMDASWNITRAVANGAFLERERAGRIVLLAPPPMPPAPGGAERHLEATRAGLENLARTLSIEWARYEITTVTIAPGVATTADQVASLCAYLASPAGAYFSGCLLDLRGPRSG
jgi:NAD(P)-dependent dehydrogenase (short-subunit alcohol dehydrogenase family)